VKELNYALAVRRLGGPSASEEALPPARWNTGVQETIVKRHFDPSATGVLLGIAIAALTAACAEPPPAAPPPPPEVLVADVIQRDVPVYLELVGQTLGFQDVEIRARVEGYLTSMNFQEGSLVRKGDLLYEIDRKPLEAILAQTRADQATAEARLAKANNDVARYRPLAAKQAVSQRELDDAVAAQDAASSQVDAAKAAVEKATLDLSYTRITAPIGGLVGTTLVKAGNLVGRGESTLLTTISQIDPALFRVGVTEADYLRVARRALDGGERAGQQSAIQLTLGDGSIYPHAGKVNVVDRAVDPSTGTLGIQLQFPNPTLLLRPGQYGRARMLLETKTGALLVQQRAVQELQNLYSVAVVDGSGKVSFKNVKVGPRVESLWVIEEGLAATDKVVVEGLQRIQDGMTVTAKPAPPTPSPTTPAVVTAGEAK
jgi:membrane fusion protein (multidrug efflux system)